MKQKLKLLILTVLVIAIGTLFFTTCKISAPDVVGCSKVKYKGVVFTLTTCSEYGASSYNVTTTQSGKTASFHITCSNRCIKTVTVIDPVV